MKRLILLVAFIVYAALSYGQEPVYNQMRSNYEFRGVRIDSLFLIPKFTDTTSAAFLSQINGSLIRVDTSIYLRYVTGHKWLKISGAAGPSVDTTSLSQRIDARVKYTDTAVMLNPYLLESDTSSLSLRIDSRVKYTDTSAMLMVYLRKQDTASLSQRIENRVKYTDTASMLLPYLKKSDTASLSQRIDNRVKYSDTSSMLLPYLRKNDTISLSQRIDQRVQYTDTASMLFPYLRKVDTANLSSRIDLKIDSLKKSADSVYFKKNGSWYYSFKDSVNAGPNGRWGNDTASIVLAKVHNDAGVTLTNGKVVFLSGSNTSSDAPAVRLAKNTADSTSANTFGFVKGTIAVNDTGWIVLSGKIEKLNTGAFNNGDVIYLDSVAGQWTASKPKAPYHMVYLGVVVKANNGNGSIFVKCQNGYELDEIHDALITNKLNNQIIAYSDTQKVWKNRNIWSVVDTSTWSARIDQRLKISDTATMLSGYMHYADSVSLSNRINTKLNISDTSVFLRDADSSVYQAKFRTDTARTNIYTSLASKELALTFSTGLTRATNTITSNLSTGVLGGQSVVGGTASGNNLTLSSTSNATKGKIIFGTSAYDEVNNRLGLGTTSPSYILDATSSGTSGPGYSLIRTQTAINNSDMGDAALYLNHSISGSGAGTELVSRVLDFRNSNSWTSGTVSNLRVFNIASSTQTNTTTTNIDQIYIESGTANGTVTSNRAIYISGLQGTNKAGFVCNALTGSNRSMILLGTASIPTGAWSIYSSSADKSYFNGNLLIGTATDAGFKLDVNGTARANQFQLSALNTAPTSATATGTLGEIRIVNGFIYVCVATNTWQRAALTTW